MTIFLTLIWSTFREAVAKKIFLGFFIISTLIILGFLFFVNSDSIEGMVAMMEASGEGGGIENVIKQFDIFILNVSYLLILTLCLISVSSFIPSMLEKGYIDLLLSKPISRTKIILGKFTGGVALIFVSLVYLMGCVWLILSLKSGYWHFPFWYGVFWLTVTFAVIYSFVILLGLLTQSTILTIIVTFFLVFLITPLLGSRESILELVNSDFVKFILDFFYYIFPKPGGINDISAKQIAGEPVVTYEPLITSLLFMFAMLSVSIYYFKNKDY